MGFRKAVRLQKILTYIGVGLLFIAYLLYFTSYGVKVVLVSVALVILFASFIISYMFVRCPHCAKKLRTIFFVIPQSCPHCKCDLDFED